MLTGNPADKAIATLRDTDLGPAADGDVAEGHFLTRLFVALKADATVSQLNAAAATVGATAIAFARNSSLLFELQIPKQTDIGELYRLAGVLRSQPGIRFAYPAREYQTAMLPEASPGQPVAASGLSHLLVSRFPQAWNARRAAPANCLSRAVDVYIADKFGNVAARPAFTDQVETNDVFIPDGNVSANDAHGYMVALILAAKLDATIPTGANPFEDCLVIHAIEALGRTELEVLGRIEEAVKRETHTPFILNVSMNFADPKCGPQSNEPCTASTLPTTPRAALQFELVYRALMAEDWFHFVTVEAPGIDQRMLVVQAAGNPARPPFDVLFNEYDGFKLAAWASPITLARNLEFVEQDLSTAPLWRGKSASSPDVTFTAPELQAALTVVTIPSESTAPNLATAFSTTNKETFDEVRPSAPTMLYLDGPVAVGDDIPLSDISTVQGTSFAAPQIAGLASYLWVLDDRLRGQPVSETRRLLQIRTAVHPPGQTFADLSIALDAYASVLALDARNGTQKIRKALLDVNNDGVFDHLDLQKFAAAYQLGNPLRPSIPSARDYSRFDLNGDGFTGGIVIAPFDIDAGPLDSDRHAVIATVEREIEGYPIDFNEAALSDVQVLCAYAYSDLYEQTSEALAERPQILGIQNCVSPRIDAVLPSPITVSQQLDTTVTMPSSGGQYAPAGNMLVEFAASGGTVNPASVQTSSNGVASTTVTALAGAALVSVTASVRGTPGGTILVQKTVSAAVAQAAPSALQVLTAYDGTQVAECSECGTPFSATTTERWLFGGFGFHTGRVRLARAGNTQGPCPGLSQEPYDACTLDFEIIDGLPPPLNPFTTPGGSFSASDSNGNSISGAVGNGQLNFAYTICSSGTSHECEKITFNGIQPIQRVTPSSLDFGTVSVGSTKSLSVQLTNHGLLPVLVIAQTFDNRQLEAKLPETCVTIFAPRGFPCLHLAPGATGSVDVEFTPLAPGELQNELAVGTDAGIDFRVPLTGTGV